MDNLFIPATTKTPEIDFKATGELKITGNSYPEDVNLFYTPVNGWLDRFLRSNMLSVSLDIELNYINTSSTKSLLNMIIQVSALTRSTVKVNWFCEIDDDDMMSVGEDIEKLSKVKFDFVIK
jgi:hypothetical protein